MKIDNLVAHIATGEENNSFVGLKILGNHINFYFPESYHFDSDDFERDDFLDLLKTINIAKSFSGENAETYDSHIDENDLALLSYIWIIEDYLKNRFYLNTEKNIRFNQRGRVNWKRTFMEQPMISNGNVVYKDIAVEVKSPQDTLISEAHRYCVKKSLVFLGWMYGLTPDIVEITSDSEKQKNRYLNAIRIELDRTFDDEKHTKLKHMENVILGLDEVSDDNNIVYGVDSFHYIFERMVNSIFGTENVTEYYPTFTWGLKYSKNKDGLSGPTIRPDTIMKEKDSERIYIIDSKFYRYGSLDLSQTNGLPEAASIVKQIMYGSYVQSKYPNSKVFNLFILPYDSRGNNGKIINAEESDIVYVGEVSSDWESDKTYGRIYTFLVDMRHIVKCWNRINHTDDRDKLHGQMKLLSV